MLDAKPTYKVVQYTPRWYNMIQQRTKERFKKLPKLHRHTSKPSPRHPRPISSGARSELTTCTILAMEERQSPARREHAGCNISRLLNNSRINMNQPAFLPLKQCGHNMLNATQHWFLVPTIHSGGASESVPIFLTRSHPKVRNAE